LWVALPAEEELVSDWLQGKKQNATGKKGRDDSTTVVVTKKTKRFIPCQLIFPFSNLFPLFAFLLPSFAGVSLIRFLPINRTKRGQQLVAQQ
jgi:hypothetical protein